MVNEEDVFKIMLSRNYCGGHTNARENRRTDKLANLYKVL